MLIAEDMERDLENASPLEGLPCELTWKIIEFVPEAVFNLRLTSRLLHARVDSFAVENNDIQLVKQLTIRGMSFFDLTFEVPNHLSNLFELRLALSDSPFNSRSCITSLFRDRPEIPTVCYRGKFNNFMENEETLSFLKRAIQGGVGRVVQSCWPDKMLKVIAELVEGIEFRKMKLSISTLTNDASSYILKRLKANINIDHLSLYVWGVELSDTVKFLLELSNRLRSLKIRQCYQYSDQRRHYFFGMDNIEWSPVILEMFSRKIEKLHIDNHLYPRYLSSASADALRKRLPRIGKKVWFEGTCNVYPIAMNYTDNEYSVQADSSETEGARYLRIKHSSRVEELFKDNCPVQYSGC